MVGRFVVVIAIFALVNVHGAVKEPKEDDLEYYYIWVNDVTERYNFVEKVLNMYKALKIDHRSYLSRFKEIKFPSALLKVPFDKEHEDQFRKLFENNGVLMDQSTVPNNLFLYNPKATEKPTTTTTTEAAALNEVDFTITAMPALQKHVCFSQILFERQIREFVEKVGKPGCCTQA